MGRKLLWSAAAGGVAVVIAVATYLGLRPDGPIYADASNARLVAMGQTVYNQQCASCHGVDLRGQANWQIELPEGGRPAPPHDESGHTWHHPDESLFAVTKQGGQPFSPPAYKNNMPAFADILTDKEILATLAYIKSTWLPRTQAQQEQINRRAQPR